MRAGATTLIRVKMLLGVVFVWMGLAVLGFSPPVQAQGARNALPPLSQPVIEVAAFQVAPLTARVADAHAKRLTSGNKWLAPVAVDNDGRAVELRVQRGERWHDVLSRAASLLSEKLPEGVQQALPEWMPQLLAGKYLRVRASAKGFIKADYLVSANEAYELRITPAELLVRPLAVHPRLVERMREDLAKASLFTATDAAGLPENIALQLAELFAGNVDFLRELHLGYSCALVYEAHYREGFIERSGRILAAELNVGKHTYRAYYALDKQGRGAYFDGNGKRTQRVFRRSPLEFTRVTSAYTQARFHPILAVWTAHRGVDYAAPTGTKVMSVADGAVEFVGERGGYGNLVVLRHQDRFRTYYAHLSAFAPNLVVGDKVKQGETIGFVGMTGLATGPHLHFEFHMRNTAGRWASIPAPDVINSTDLAGAGFAERVRVYRASLSVASLHNPLILE